jgi:hypothetical protein
MTQGGEPPQQKRRNQAKPNTDPKPLPLYRPEKSVEKAPDPQNYNYAIDEGLSDTPLTRTSVVRRRDLPPTTQSQRIAIGSQAPLPTVPQRSQALPPGTRTLRQPVTAPAQHPSQRPKRKSVHWLLPVGIGMLAMLALWVTSTWVLAWGVQRYNDIHYGTPRTYQTDAVVGHNEDSAKHPSHFIAVNFNRQAVITEFMAGDPAKTEIYVAPLYIAGDGGDLAPVTVEFRMVAGGTKPDMIVHVHLSNQVQDQLYVFVNDGTHFRPSIPSDKIHL